MNPLGIGFVQTPNLRIDAYSEFTAGSEVISNITNRLVLNAYEFSATVDLPAGTYGNPDIIPAPWAAYQFTISINPILQIGDAIAGAGIPALSTVTYVGTNGFDDWCVTGIAPPLGNLTIGGKVHITRLRTNDALIISTTTADTDISLQPAGQFGRVTAGSSIHPLVSDQYNLGTPARRWREIWLGAGTLYVQDETLGTDLAIGARDGNLYVAGAAGLSVGEFTFVDNEIRITDDTRDIIIGVPQATGNVTLNRPLRITSGITGLDTFSVSREGRVQIKAPSIPTGDQGAFNIVGSSDGSYQPVNGAGGMIHITGNDNTLARITVDGYATSPTGAQPAQAGYGLVALRAARGTAAAPSYVLANDILASFSGLGYVDGSGYSTGQVAGFQFFAAEDFVSNAHKGTYAQFKLTPVGGSAGIVAMQFNSDGIDLINTGSKITFGDDTVQTTAWTGSTSYTNITGLGTVAHTNTYSDLSGLPNLFSGNYSDLTGAPTDNINVINAGTGISYGRSGNTVSISNSGVLSVAAASGTGQLGVSTVGGAVTLTMPQGLATTSNVTFNDLTINGTLTVENFNLSTAPTIAGKILYLAADATQATDIDGGGLWLGPIGDAYSRSILYNLQFDRWDFDGAGVITQELTADMALIQGQAHFGNAYVDYDFTNATVQIDGNANSYLQTVIKNHNTGPLASADFVAVNNIGDDNSHYIDMGINSSIYANSDYSIGGANDGYLYINGGDLTVGTQTATKVIKFHTGGTTSDKLRATITDTGLTVIGVTSSTSFSGPLTGNVTGNVSGNAGTVTNGVYTTDTGTVTNTMLAGSIANNKLSNSSVTVNGTTIALGGSGTVTAAAGTLTGNILASGVTASSLTSVGTLTNLTVTNPITGSVTGNAGTVTNGVYTTGTYSNPSWLTSLAYSKISGAPTSLSSFSNEPGYITNAALTGYATQSYVTSQGYITSSALTGYATQTYVNSQGFITTGSLSVTSNTPSGTTSTLIYSNGVFTFTSAASSSYTLPTASTVTLGGVKVDGTSVTINGSGVISAPYTYTLPTASTTILGGVKVDGTTVTINGSGVISSVSSGGTVTSVSALTIGSAGVDVTSTVANSTTTPVITLNIPTASATARGALSSTDWTTFNNKTSNVGTVTSVSGTGTVSGLTLTGTVTSTGNLTLGGTLSLTSGQVTTALGYTPGTGNGTVTSVSGTGTVSGLTLTGSFTTSGSLTLGGTLSLTSGQVITALGFTPLQTAVTSIAGGNNIVLSGSTGSVTISRVDGLQTVVTGNSGSTYNVLTTDQYIGSTRSATGTGTITLPLGSTVTAGRQYIIKDEGGFSGSSLRRITVAASGSDTIDGSATRSITSNYGSLTVLWTGTRWSVI